MCIYIYIFIKTILTNGPDPPVLIAPRRNTPIAEQRGKGRARRLDPLHVTQGVGGGGGVATELGIAPSYHLGAWQF